MKQQLLTQKKEMQQPPIQKQRKMSKSFCPNCQSTKNCFPIDYLYFNEKEGQKNRPIWLCLSCCEILGYSPDLIYSCKCKKCGELYRIKKSNVCPVCWIQCFDCKERWKNERES